MKNPLWLKKKKKKSFVTHQVTASLLCSNTAEYVAAVRGFSVTASQPGYCLLVLQHEHITPPSLLIRRGMLHWSDLSHTDEMPFVFCLNTEHRNLCDNAEQRGRRAASCCSVITFKVMNESSREMPGI